MRESKRKCVSSSSSPKEREIKTRPSWSAAWQATELGLGKQAAANRARRFSLWRYPLSSLFELWRHDSNAHKDRRRRRGDRQTGLWSGGVPGYMFQRFYFIFFLKIGPRRGGKKIYIVAGCWGRSSSTKHRGDTKAAF